MRRTRTTLRGESTRAADHHVELNRHRLAHLRQARGTRLDTLRCFLLLDPVVAFADVLDDLCRGRTGAAPAIGVRRTPLTDLLRDMVSARSSLRHLRLRWGSSGFEFSVRRHPRETWDDEQRPDRCPGKLALVVALLVLALALAGCGGGSTGSTATTASDLRTATIESSGGEEVEVRVEIADSPDERATGLMDRTALAEDRGMLFIFPDEEVRSFWMRNTLIPLSIAYIDSEGRIVDIQDMKPLDDDPPHYVSAEPAQYALEVNQGFFEESGVEVGDRAELPV